MPTLGTPPTSPPRRSTKSRLRQFENCCCRTIAYFPLVFVYGLTTWAVWVEVKTSFLGSIGWLNYIKAFLGAGLYTLANLCYTIAVFTNPGSPLDDRKDYARSYSRYQKGTAYEGLPTHEDEQGVEQGWSENMTLVTAKSSGKPRFCKKCRCVKPDRTHHCSTCGQCVLKMDHHCPWLATCVGLRNYKSFLLFLIYTSIFCWLCFFVTGSWVWVELLDDVPMDEGLMVVNTILLAVLGGIIGLVLSGFTGWHIYLAVTGQTTIESLEKTRYLSPLRKSLEPDQPGRHSLAGPGELGEEQGITDQLKEIHANALPGVLRPEEGEESRDPSRSTTPNQPRAFTPATTSSPAKDSLHRNFASLEAQREQDRYQAYLDEVDSEKLPNAFDIGWRRNLQHVFGDRPLLCALPICNTGGDGWQWAINPDWYDARTAVAREREAREREDAYWGPTGNGPFGTPAPPRFEGPRRDLQWVPGAGFVNKAPAPPPPPPPRGSSRPTSRNAYHARSESSSSNMQLQPLDRRKTPGDPGGGGGSGSGDDYDTSSSSASDEEVKRLYSQGSVYGYEGGNVANWNDVPEDYLVPPGGRKGGVARSRSRGRRKGD
ncbi:hypothetical protein B0A50_07608 [Salinomyces thailandicus]|uniref:Palmitoyltransferase n=1 Tax=Salinomyces thailandicus TaxID=706561 RepID=A0A4U0TN99_9PEZI|nr:hypothetical protein B0A50_07608 [Salinomyces thailandica]